MSFKGIELGRGGHHSIPEPLEIDSIDKPSTTREGCDIHSSRVPDKRSTLFSHFPIMDVHLGV